jgi:aminopeptidase YwaD
MKRALAIFLFLCLGAALVSPARAQQIPLLPESTVSALAQELSGETAKRNLEFLARLHRQRGSRDFHTAAEFIVTQAHSYGLEDAHIEQFPADGKIFYGTQRSRLAWDADFAELWEVREQNGKWQPVARLGDFQAMPVSLAEDSENGEVTADLVDVGAGTSEKDYADKNVRGKIVLTSQQPGEIEDLAIEEFGAAGIVSYALNQPQAWRGEDENLVRWGHLESFPKTPAFAFMISLKTSRDLRTRLARGEQIRLHATVHAGRHPGFYEVATATIPGADANLRQQEIVFSCHLDHERPGANDNLSGCVTILEVARTLQKLITEGSIPRPARTIRFVWPAEMEGTLALLNGKPELVPHLLAVVHMDMVGGGEVTKSIFHIERAPASLPSFVNDVAEAFGEFVNEQSYEFAATGHAAYPLVAPEGTKQALLAQFAEYTPGSDHDIYQCGSFRIPAIYMNDWPDRYIHTNFDAAANIDPTKLLRAGFIGGASGYFLANFAAGDVSSALRQVEIGSLRRTATMFRRRKALRESQASRDMVVVESLRMSYESDVFASIERFRKLTAEKADEVDRFLKSLSDVIGSPGIADKMTGDQLLVFEHNPNPKGPMTVFGYDYLTDHFGADRTRALKLLNYEGLRAGGPEYAYETLNFVDGKRNAQQIHDAVAAEFGPVPFEDVLEYLRALESAGVLQLKK